MTRINTCLASAEEWLTRKKVTTTKVKNIETRTQRKVVLEDGEVVEDSGPIVTTDCKEDTVTNEVVADEVGWTGRDGKDGGEGRKEGGREERMGRWRERRREMVEGGRGDGEQGRRE